MPQVLLRSNRRFGTLGVSLALLCLAAGGAVAWLNLSRWLVFGGLTLVVIGVFVAFLAGTFLATPRVMLSDRELILYLRSMRKPFHVPLDVVEVFFIGQGAVAGDEPGQPREYEGAVAANVIVRLAESKNEWHSRAVNDWLAVWDDGYITLRGLWCENIDQELLKSMNGKLIAAKRALREKQQPQEQI